MSDRYKLNETRSPIDPSSWRELNQNWELIQSYLRFLERQIKFLSGGAEIDEILLRIDTAIENAENATVDVEQAKQEIEAILVDLNTLVIAAEAATENANTAANKATTLNNTLSSLKTELETLQTNLNGIVQAEVQRVTEETNRRENEAARVLKEQARESAELQRNATFETKMTEADQKTATMRDLISKLVSYNYTPSATYNFPNLIKYNGSTFIALQRVTGTTPVDDGVNYRLVAEKGAKGDTGAGVNILGQFDDSSELPGSGNVGDAYLVGGNLYIWGGTNWVDGGNIKGPRGDTATGINVFDYTINASDTAQVALNEGATINPTDYLYNADTDTIDVYRNSRILYPGLDYNIEEGTIQVIQPVAEPDKTTFYIRVTRVVYRIDEDAGRETIVNALGYTPANDTNLAEVEQRLTTQLAQTGQQIEGTHSRIDGLIFESGNANVEVADAHTSVLKNKTYPTLNSRLQALENDTLLPIRNIITNGSFESDKTNWTSAGSAGAGGGSSIDTEIKLIGNKSLKIINVNGARRETQTIETIVGHKYYQRVNMYLTAYTSGNILLKGINISIYADTNKLNQWQSLSRVSQAISSSATVYQGTENTSSWTANFDGILIVDLTTTFGVGNEPTPEEFEKILAKYPSYWFDGITSYSSAAIKIAMQDAKESIQRLTVAESKLNAVTSSQDFPATNVILNGSFENNKTNWTSIGVAGSGGGSVIDENFKLYGTKSLKITNVTSGTRREEQAVNAIIGHKYYQSVNVRITSHVAGNIAFKGGESTVYADTSKVGEWQRLSAISQATAYTYSIMLGTVVPSDWVVNFDGVLLVDLTATFGEGNEPTKEEFEKILAYHNNWFEGTINPLLSYKQLFALSKKTPTTSTAVNIMPVGYIDNPKVTDWKGQAMVTLSYDDGLRNNYHLALPLHEKHGIPATFNVISSRFASRSFFDEAMTRECHERGVEIASHSHFHNTALTGKTDAELHVEFGESKRLIEEVIGTSVDTIAIPFSNYDERVKAIAQQYYKGVRVHSNLQNSMPPTDRYWINSRIAVNNTTTFPQIKTRIDEAIAQGKWCIIMLHGIDNQLRTEYDVTQKLLDDTLAYIRSFGRDTLLPINTKDALKFTLGTNY